MNERIWELSDKCGLAWTLKTPQDIKNLEEFAELIVRECIDIVGEYSEDGAYCQRQMIKERFGVK